jgi:protocatechuate 3,4-dioxygenase alpha subunit
MPLPMFPAPTTARCSNRRSVAVLAREVIMGIVYDRARMSQTPVPLVATSSQTVGPFFHFGLADNATLGCLVRDETRGERIRLRIGVFDGDGAPVPDALVELWQADADGVYVRPADPKDVLSPSGFCGFGRLPTGADGTCVFETIRPGAERDALGRSQAPHINVCLLARGLLRQIYTRIYFAGDPALEADVVLALVPESRRRTLLAQPGGPGDWVFDIRFQGDAETVFFDL